MKDGYGAAIEKYFSSLSDPRMSGKVRHKLIDIIMITLCAVISGADAWTEVEEYGRAKYEWFKSFSELPSDIPSHDTSGNVFAALCVLQKDTIMEINHTTGQNFILILISVYYIFCLCLYLPRKIPDNYPYKIFQIFREY